jgi:hypothetical protein
MFPKPVADTTPGQKVRFTTQGQGKLVPMKNSLATLRTRRGLQERAQ